MTAEELHRWLFGSPQHTEEADLAKINAFALDVKREALRSIAQQAMLASSDPHKTAEQYRASSNSGSAGSPSSSRRGHTPTYAG